MRHIFGVILLTSVGCTEDARILDEWSEPWEMEWTEYTRVNQLGGARLHIDGPSLSAWTTPLAKRTPLPIVDLGPPMRVLVTQNGLTFLAYLDDQYVQEVVSEYTRGEANPTGSDAAGVWLPPGTAVTWLADTTDSEHVAYTNDGVDLETWIPNGIVQPYVTPEVVTWPTQDGRPVVLRDGTMLLDAPHGTAFGSLEHRADSWETALVVDTNLEGRHAVAVGAAVEGHQLVAIDTIDDVHIRAFVSTTDLIPLNNGLGMRGYGRGTSSVRLICGMHYGGPYVRKGTPVYDALEGAVVGWVTEDRFFDIEIVDSDWARAPMSLTWETSEVWLKRSDIITPEEHVSSLFTQQTEFIGTY